MAQAKSLLEYIKKGRVSSRSKWEERRSFLYKGAHIVRVKHAAGGPGHDTWVEKKGAVLGRPLQIGKGVQCARIDEAPFARLQLPGLISYPHLDDPLRQKEHLQLPVPVGRNDWAADHAAFPGGIQHGQIKMPGAVFEHFAPLAVKLHMRPVIYHRFPLLCSLQYKYMPSRCMRQEVLFCILKAASKTRIRGNALLYPGPRFAAAQLFLQEG